MPLRPSHVRPSLSGNNVSSFSSISEVDDDQMPTVSQADYPAWLDGTALPNVPRTARVMERSASSPSISTSKARPYKPPSLRSAHSVRLDSDSIKPLSPIVEQEYLSPDLGLAALPRVTGTRRPSILDEFNFPYPPTSSTTPFLTRPLNKAVSFISTQSHLSSAPTLSPLDLRPNFNDSIHDDASSIRAESFRSCDTHGPAPSFSFDRHPPSVFKNSWSSRLANGPSSVYDHASLAEQASVHSMIQSMHGTQGTSRSIFDRNWFRRETTDAPHQDRGFTSPPSRPPSILTASPACILFWLGFIAPWCWLIGGWTIWANRREGNPLGDSLLPLWRKWKKNTEDVVRSDQDSTMSGSTFASRRPSQPKLKKQKSSLRSSMSTRFGGYDDDPWVKRCRYAALISGAVLTIAFIIAVVVVNRSR